MTTPETPEPPTTTTPEPPTTTKPEPPTTTTTPEPTTTTTSEPPTTTPACTEFALSIYNVGYPISSMPATSASQLVGTACTMEINVENGDGNQYTPNDYFAATWSGSFQVTTGGSYSFAAGSDDGSILYIDGSEVVNNDGLHAFQYVENFVSLNAGQHSVVVNFFQNEGNAGISVWWNGPDTGDSWVLLQSSPDAPLPTCNAFKLSVYNLGYSISSMPATSASQLVGTACTADIDVENGDGNQYWTSLVQATPHDYFAATWSGNFQVTTGGSYSFAAGSDDGSIVYIDGSEVVNNDGLHPFQTVNGVVNLNAGQHSVVVNFFQNDGPDTGNTWALLQS